MITFKLKTNYNKIKKSYALDENSKEWWDPSSKMESSQGHTYSTGVKMKLLFTDS